MNKYTNLLMTLACTIFMTACADSYTFNSNLNSAAIQSYFKPGTVQVFDDAHLPPPNYKKLAMVEGESCQLSKNDKPASTEDARTAARVKAADLQANGIIFRRCVAFDTADQRCVSRVNCFGHAITINVQD